MYGFRINYKDLTIYTTALQENKGFSIADHHFSPACMKPEILMIKSDNYVRSLEDFLILDQLDKVVFTIP